MTKTALLVIDVQNLLIDEQPYAIADRLVAWADMIETARQKGLPVIYIRHTNEEFVEGSQGWQISSAIAPKETDTILNKAYNSAFKGTDLQAVLIQLGVERLILVGMQTNFCIDVTAKVAFELGYQVGIVKDGTTTTDLGPFAAADLIAYHEQVWEWSVARVAPFEDLLDD